MAMATAEYARMHAGVFHGTVERISKDAGSGVIRDKDGTEVLFSLSDVNGGAGKSARAGDGASFQFGVRDGGAYAFDVTVSMIR